MTIMLIECSTDEEHFVVPILCTEGLNANDIQKEMCLSREAVQLGGKHFADDSEVETEARKWLRQQS
jgi:hypothetical protein